MNNLPEREPNVKDLLLRSRIGLLVVFVFSLFVNLLRFATPVYLLQVLDRVVASRSLATLLMLTVIAVAAVLTGLALDVIRKRMLLRIGAWLEIELAPKIVHSSFKAQKNGRFERPTELLRGLQNIRQFIGRSLVNFIDLAFAPIFLLVIYHIHPLLGLVSIIGCALLVAAGLVKRAVMSEATSSSRKASQDAGQVLALAQRNGESIGALGMMDSLMERWRRTASVKTDQRSRLDHLNTSFEVLVRGIARLLRIAMIFFGIWLFLVNAVTLGGVFAARILATVVFRIVTRAMRNWRSLQDARSAYADLRSMALTHEPPEATLPGNTLVAPVQLENVAFRYPGERTSVFSNLSLTLGSGQLLLVSGGAESGKTTLSRLIVGLHEPRSGQVRLGEVSISRLPAESRRREIGYLPQDLQLIDGTVRENIARFVDRPLEEVVTAARLVGLHEEIVRLPEGYDTSINCDLIGLAGGKRQRIALARAFVGAPRLIVLDEPMNHLDALGRRQLEAALIELKNLGSTVVVTQSVDSPRLARIADLFLNLDKRPPEFSTAAEYVHRKATSRLRRVE